MPAYRISLFCLFVFFFALNTNQKFAIFVWIFACVDFHGKIKTKVSRTIAKGTTWNRDISCLPLKPPKSFKPWNTIRIRFAFLWIWPERVMGRQRQENFQKTSWKAKKNFFSTPSAIFVIFQTCFQSSLTVLFFLLRVCFFYNCHGKKTKH